MNLLVFLMSSYVCARLWSDIFMCHGFLPTKVLHMHCYSSYDLVTRNSKNHQVLSSLCMRYVLEYISSQIRCACLCN